MEAEEYRDIMEAVWLDPRIDTRLHDTCNALRAAVMSKTLKENKSDGGKLIKQGDALKNRNDWALDKKHVYCRMILIHDAPSWLQPAGVMVQHYEPIWFPKEFNIDGSPPLGHCKYRSPNAESPWAIHSRASSEDVSRSYKRFITNRIAIAKCLR
jgi:hypothetical protein